MKKLICKLIGHKLTGPKDRDEKYTCVAVLKTNCARCGVKLNLSEVCPIMWYEADV